MVVGEVALDTKTLLYFLLHNIMTFSSGIKLLWGRAGTRFHGIDGVHVDVLRLGLGGASAI